jgi:putative methionine-R-sulfoxide reductase with GAF domain
LVIVMDDRIIATLDIDAPEWDQCFTAASVTQ